MDNTNRIADERSKVGSNDGAKELKVVAIDPVSEQPIVKVGDDYLKQYARKDSDNPAVSPLLIISAIVCLVGLIWALVSIDGIVSALTPYWNSAQNFFQQLSGPQTPQP